MQFSFREVSKKDEKMLFEWQNDSYVRNWSFNKKPILFLQHQKYLRKKISDKNFLMWIFLFKDKPCGLVRTEINKNKAILNYLISKKYRGMKLSSVMLTLAKNKICKQFPKIVIYAHTLPKNIISIKSLLRSGFVFDSSDQNKNIYAHRCT